MKLTTAEDWLEHFDQVLWEDLSPKDFHEINQLIRQIQADALRFAADQFHQAISECTAIANVPQRIDLEIEHFDNLANQLHPLPEAKPK